MGRDELKSGVELGGFIEYGKEQLPKVDSQRRDMSQPDFMGVPILHDSDVIYGTAETIGNKPASCKTCKEQTRDCTCERLGPSIKVCTVIGHKDSGDPIEYWPCCGMHDYADPDRDKGAVHYHDTLDNPDDLGLIWINAPKPGLEFSGANCGGANDGDDCDHYLVGKGEKWDNPQGYCRVLAHAVGSGDICTAWRDDDILDWREAQQLMAGKSVDSIRKMRDVRVIVGRSDASSISRLLRPFKPHAKMGAEEKK